MYKSQLRLLVWGMCMAALINWGLNCPSRSKLIIMEIIDASHLFNSHFIASN